MVVCYVDDSHSCLKKDQVDQFHKHLNLNNLNIQFTLGIENTKGRQSLPFLGFITSRHGTAVQVDVYRKPTHTGHYLDSLSCHPLCQISGKHFAGKSNERFVGE